MAHQGRVFSSASEIQVLPLANADPPLPFRVSPPPPWFQSAVPYPLTVTPGGHAGAFVGGFGQSSFPLIFCPVWGMDRLPFLPERPSSPRTTPQSKALTCSLIPSPPLAPPPPPPFLFILPPAFAANADLRIAVAFPSSPPPGSPPYTPNMWPQPVLPLWNSPYSSSSRHDEDLLSVFPASPTHAPCDTVICCFFQTGSLGRPMVVLIFGLSRRSQSPPRHLAAYALGSRMASDFCCFVTSPCIPTQFLGLLASLPGRGPQLLLGTPRRCSPKKKTQKPFPTPPPPPPAFTSLKTSPAAAFLNTTLPFLEHDPQVPHSPNGIACKGK